MRFSAISGFVLAAFMGLSQADAATINFANIPGGSTAGDSLVSRFTLDVTQYSLTKVLIKISSAVAAHQSYFIGSIFIDDDPSAVLNHESTAFDAADSSANVAFQYKASGAFPQGNLVGFVKTTRYDAKKGSGNKWAVQPGETAAFLFDGSYAAVLASLQANVLRFGIHVQGLPCDESDSFVTRYVQAAPPPPPPPPTVPLPASALLLLGALGGLAGLRRTA
jgi:hypothetical protein